MFTRQQAEEVMRVSVTELREKHWKGQPPADSHSRRVEDNHVHTGVRMLLEANRLLEQAGFEIRSKA